MRLFVSTIYGDQARFCLDIKKSKGETETVTPPKIVFYDDELNVKLITYYNHWITNVNITGLFKGDASLPVKRKVDYTLKEPYVVNGKKGIYDSKCEKILYIPASFVTIEDMGFSIVTSTETGYFGMPQKVVRHCYIKELNLRVEETLLSVDEKLFKIRNKWTNKINEMAQLRSIDDMSEVENIVDQLKDIKKQYDITFEYYKNDFNLQEYFKGLSIEDIDVNGDCVCSVCGTKHKAEDIVWAEPHQCFCKDCYEKADKDAIWRSFYNYYEDERRA